MSLSGAWVGRDPDDLRCFAVMIDAADPAPSGWVGPQEWRRFSDIETAVEYAIENADEVVVVFGLNEGTRFTAGRQPYSIEALPAWPPDTSTRQRIEHDVESTIARINAERANAQAGAPHPQLGVAEPSYVRRPGSPGDSDPR